MALVNKLLMWGKFHYIFCFFDVAELRHRFFAKKIMSPGEEECIKDEVVIVTGASCGIGKAIAKEFAKRNARVVMGCFNTQEGKEAMLEIRKETGNSNLEVIYLDLSDMDVVQTFALEVAGKYPQIKILCLNGGLGAAPKWLPTKEGFNYDVAVNYLCHFLLTNLLLDNLQLSNSARVIAMSSTMGMMAQMDLEDFMMEKSGTGFWGLLPFANTSFAKSLFMKELGERLIGTGITTCSVCPGAVRTKLWDAGRTTKLKSSVTDFVLWVHAFTPEQTASEIVMYCALSKKLAKDTGNMYRFRQKFSSANKKLKPGLSKKLWAYSATHVKLEERMSAFKSDLNALHGETVTNL